VPTVIPGFTFRQLFVTVNKTSGEKVPGKSGKRSGS